MRIDTGIVLAAALVLSASAWGLVQILSAPPRPALAERPAVQAGPVPAPAALQAIAARLRPPEPAAVREPVREPVTSRAPDMRLIGLIETDGEWVALFSLSGEAVTARPGDVVGGYRLSDIDARTVWLERGDERLRLELD